MARTLWRIVCECSVAALWFVGLTLCLVAFWTMARDIVGIFDAIRGLGY